MEYEVLLKQNEWLNNYKGQTFNQKLADKLLKGVFEEQLPKCDIISNIKRRTLITVTDPMTKEIHSIGASALLRDKRGKIQMNLFNENLVRLCLLIFGNSAGVTDANLKDDTGALNTVSVYGNGGGIIFQYASGQGIGKFGSGNTVGRNDATVQTALGNAPENGYVNPSTPQIFTDEHITWVFAIANAGGSGTVNEFGQFMRGNNTSIIAKQFMLWHDVTNPASYVAGKSISATISMQF